MSSLSNAEKQITYYLNPHFPQVYPDNQLIKEGLEIIQTQPPTQKRIKKKEIRKKESPNIAKSKLNPTTPPLTWPSLEYPPLSSQPNYPQIDR